MGVRTGPHADLCHPQLVAVSRRPPLPRLRIEHVADYRPSGTPVHHRPVCLVADLLTLGDLYLAAASSSVCDIGAPMVIADCRVVIYTFAHLWGFAHAARQALRQAALHGSSSPRG